jgi:hypothetical protein
MEVSTPVNIVGVRAKKPNNVENSRQLKQQRLKRKGSSVI